MTTQPIESHAVHSRRMLEHAALMLEQGDRLQASEKIWGAAVHRLKEIAEARGWPNAGRADIWAIIGHITALSGEPRIDELFAVANDTHQNFYEDRYSLTQLMRRHEQISALLELLDEAQRTMPPDPPMPTDRHYRCRHNLTAANRS